MRGFKLHAAVRCEVEDSAGAVDQFILRNDLGEIGDRAPYV